MSVLVALVAVGAAAAAAAAVATRRVLARRSRPKLAEAPAEPPIGPLSIGDVVVLEGGRGRELWIARALVLREGDADPFLVLYEADGPDASRAVIAVEAARAERVGLLSARALVGAGGRLPSSFEQAIDGASVVLVGAGRRIADAELRVAPDATGATRLPAPGTVSVATYRGGADACAVIVIAAGGGALAWVGREIAFGAVSVLGRRQP